MSHTLLLNRPHLIHLRPLAAHLLLKLWSEKSSVHLFVRECFSSNTTAQIIDDEKAKTLRLAITQSCVELRPMDGPFAVVRTDPAPGFQELANDPIPKSYQMISIELGHFKNANKNPVATYTKNWPDCKSGILSAIIAYWTLHPSTVWFDKGVCLQGRLLKGTSSQIDNCLYRTGSSYNRNMRLAMWITSVVRYLAPHPNYSPNPLVEVGNLVYLYCDRNKSKARNWYLVVSAELTESGAK